MSNTPTAGSGTGNNGSSDGPRIITLENVQQAISALAGELQELQKTPPAGGGVNYATLREDAVLDAVHPLMIRYQLTVVPIAVLELQRTTIPTHQSVMQNTMAVFGFRFTHVASDTSIDAYAVGEGADVAGMSAAKAQTSAFKMVLRQTFRVRIVPPQGQRPQGQQSNQRPAQQGQPPRTAQRNPNLVSEFWAAIREARIQSTEVTAALRGRKLEEMTQDQLYDLFDALNNSDDR